MRLAHYATSAGAALFLALCGQAQNIPVGQNCDVDVDCASGCCGTEISPTALCLDKTTRGPGESCQTDDGCDCQIGRCDGGFCEAGAPSPSPGFAELCSQDTDCPSGCCGDRLDTNICIPKSTQGAGEQCFSQDGCDCTVGTCLTGECQDNITVCNPDFSVCGDPHMQGLRGQKIDWSGVDGGWYCLVTDDNMNIHVNVRLTAPLPEAFPDRQLITGLSVVSEGHSLAIEVKNPYHVDTADGCPTGVSPCLANGALRAIVDGEVVDDLLRFSRDRPVAHGSFTLSASNLPVECRQFGGDKAWASMYQEMLQGTRQLRVEESFEDWILMSDHTTAPDWCTQYIEQRDLADVQSTHAVFKIVTPGATVRLNIGTNFQGNGDVDWDGRVLPDLEFWQMDAGLRGLPLESDSLSGILGETARPVLDGDGNAVMKGYDAFRGTVEDYRVSGSLGTDFALLNDKK